MKPAFVPACSVPSDSPDDWRALEDLRSPQLAGKYGLDVATHVEPFEVRCRPASNPDGKTSTQRTLPLPLHRV